MSRGIFSAVLGAGAMLVIAVAGIYVTAKPYQRERIWITVQGMSAIRSQPPH